MVLWLVYKLYILRRVSRKIVLNVFVLISLWYSYVMLFICCSVAPIQITSYVIKHRKLNIVYMLVREFESNSVYTYIYLKWFLFAKIVFGFFVWFGDSINTNYPNQLFNSLWKRYFCIFFLFLCISLSPYCN